MSMDESLFGGCSSESHSFPGTWFLLCWSASHVLFRVTYPSVVTSRSACPLRLAAVSKVGAVM